MDPRTKERLISKARPDIAVYLIAVQDRELMSNHTVWQKRWLTAKSGTYTEARDRYDNGEVDLVQQRVGECEYLLYAIPRKDKAFLMDVFKLGYVEEKR